MRPGIFASRLTRLVACVAVACSGAPGPLAPETPATAGAEAPATGLSTYAVRIDAGRLTSQKPVRLGLGSGFQVRDEVRPDAALLPKSLAPLEIASWGAGQQAFERYPSIAKLVPEVVFALQGIYFDQRPAGFGARPWQEGNQWPERWRDFCAGVVAQSLQQGKRIRSWDVWAEPDSPQMGAHWSQLLEMTRSAVDGVKSADPRAQVTGGRVGFFEHEFACVPDAQCNPAVDPADPGDRQNRRKDLFDFVYELSRPPYNTRLDGIGWHEFNRPSNLIRDAQKLRAFLRDPARFQPPYEPELHISEYGNSVTHVVPGFTLAFIDNAERAGIQSLSPACWDVYETDPNVHWSTCWEGMNGLYMRDLRTPQQKFHVFRAYAELTGGDRYARIAAESGDPHISALAGRSDATRKLYVLIGLHSEGGVDAFAVQGGVDVVISQFPYPAARAKVVLRQIALDTDWVGGIARAHPSAGPRVIFSGSVDVRDGTLEVPIHGKRAELGSVYVIEISAAS